jgi:predicted RNA-binding protein with PIN domain
MAYILIDGYNLIGIAHKNLEKARNDIIEKLCKYSEIKSHNITLVFDGWKSGQNIETKMRIGNVSIIYSKLGEKADFVIKKILSEKTKPWIVVSSDREIADFAYKKDFVSVSANEFEDKLYAALAPLSPPFVKGEMEGFSEELDMMPTSHKGSPRKLSKKQKKKLRVLEKL